MLKNKIVLITGASSGIGKACAEQFAALGAHLILTARRLDRITHLAQALEEQYEIRTFTAQLDVRDKNAVKDAITTLPADWQNIDVLVNNAGLALTTDKTQDSDVDNWDVMIDTNVKGLLYVTHAVLQGMVARNCGHIINIGSVAGVEYYLGGNVYSATKHAVHGFTQSLRLDLLDTPIRVSEILPGAVETEFSVVRWNDPDRAKQMYAGFTPLCPDDIADNVIYCATRKPHVNIAEILVFPTAQGSAAQIHRRQAE